jgi:tetratricopeptide (TPR) repeat protein
VSAISFQQRQAQARRLELALRDAYRKRQEAQDTATGDPAKWRAALAAVDRAADLLGPLSDAPSRREVLALQQEVAAAAEAADRDSSLLRSLFEIRAEKAADPFGYRSDETYAWAFRTAGLDIDKLEPDAAASQIRTRPAGVIPMLAVALDDWATLRRKARPKEIESSRRLIAVARAADPDETRNRLRAVWLQPDGRAQREPLLALAKEADPRQWPAQTLTLLATCLLDADEPATAAELLQRAQAHHPGDVWINHTLGQCLERVKPPRLDDAIRFYTAARALRPETAHDLAHALNRRGRDDEALAVFQDLTERNPENGRHWACLATLREARADRDGARMALQCAYNIFRQTILNRPDDVATHVNLAGLLSGVAHRYPEAAAEFRAALRLDPENVKAHFGLGNALREQGELGEAAAAYRTAIRITPDFGPAHQNLAYVLLQQGNVDGAIAEGRESLRLQPDAAAVPGNLAWLLAVYPDRPARDYEEAATLVRKSLEMQPKVPVVHHNLALVEYRRGHWVASIASAERAMALRKGGLPNDWFLLAMALARKGENQKAVEWFDKAVEQRRKLKMTVDDVLILWSEAARLLGRPGPPSAARAVP